MERERQKRWDRENLCTISSKMLPREYRTFRLACDAAGVTMYTLIRRLVRDWLMQFAQQYPDAARRILERRE